MIPEQSLQGFAKRDDLAYLLDTICDMSYVHEPRLAPTKEILDAYKKGSASWQWYEDEFLRLIKQRAIEDTIPQDMVAERVLLCSEERPHQCHRRLVAEYLAEHWDDIQIVHLS